jgi:hypothetical protein
MTKQIRRLQTSTAIALGLVLTCTVLAWALVSYSFGTAAALGGASQTGQWLNGTNAVGVTVDKTVSPVKTYTHLVYVSDYTTSGAFTTDNTCSGSNACLANYYQRSADGGKTFGAPVQLPRPANTATERATLAVTGKTLIAGEVTQQLYYQNGTTFDVSKPRAAYVTRNTNHGTGSWSNAVKLPGQSTTSRVDYLNAWASGANVFIVTTDVDTGNIWLWRSTDRGSTWGTGPRVIGTTTFQDLATAANGGYVGGYSGLPTIAAAGVDVVASWIDNPTGRIVSVVSNDGGASWSAETQLEASGGADNAGYVQEDGHDTRVAVAWTTGAGAFLQIYDGSANAWGAKRTIVTFPDAAVGGSLNVAGEGAMVALGPNAIVGVALSECNQLTGGTGCALDLSNSKAREQLVWRASDDNGATWSAPNILANPTTAKTSFISNYGDAIFVKTKPLVLWNGHDAAYGYYKNFRRVGTAV